MAAKPSFRRPLFAALAALIAVLALGASSALASTGGVYVDADGNAAAGNPAFLFNSTFNGIQNVGLARTVMPNLTGGSGNTALGYESLFADRTGDGNLAAGTRALTANTTGSANVASGDSALSSNTTGRNNVASGLLALGYNTTGNNNTALGYAALVTSTGDDNIALGYAAGQNLTTGSNNVDIANFGKAGESKVMRLGTKGDQVRTYVAGISDRTVSGTAQPVVVNAQGQLGTASAAKASPGPKPLSAADGRRMMAEIERLKARVQKLGG